MAGKSRQKSAFESLERLLQSQLKVAETPASRKEERVDSSSYRSYLKLRQAELIGLARTEENDSNENR